MTATTEARTDSVGEDSALRPEEKQVSFVATKDDDRFRVHAEVTGVISGLLQHPEFIEERRRQQGTDVVAVTGTIPIHCVKVSVSPRQYGSWSSIVSRPSE